MRYGVTKLNKRKINIEAIIHINNKNKIRLKTSIGLSFTDDLNHSVLTK